MLCLFPGWGFDCRIFDRVAWPCETLCESAGPLLEQLDARGLARVSLFGWSLGATRALKFARLYPDRVERVLLAGLRPRFLEEEIAAEKAALMEDPQAALRRFYRRAFAGQKREFDRFTRELEPALVASLDLAELQAGLDELRQSCVQTQDLSFGAPDRHPILVHGKRDLIAPVGEIESVARAAGARLTVLPHVGHVVFLSEPFLPWLNAELHRPVE